MQTSIHAHTNAGMHTHTHIPHMHAVTHTHTHTHDKYRFKTDYSLTEVGDKGRFLIGGNSRCVSSLCLLLPVLIQLLNKIMNRHSHDNIAVRNHSLSQKAE